MKQRFKEGNLEDCNLIIKGLEDKSIGYMHVFFHPINSLKGFIIIKNSVVEYFTFKEHSTYNIIYLKFKEVLVGEGFIFKPFKIPKSLIGEKIYNLRYLIEITKIFLILLGFDNRIYVINKDDEVYGKILESYNFKILNDTFSQENSN